VREVKGVFGVYGINVSPRHLGLIADYMTFLGSYRPLNRLGMSESGSTLQQMSFETTSKFLLAAAAGGHADEMVSPSAAIVVGAPAKVGTGTVHLRVPMHGEQ